MNNSRFSSILLAFLCIVLVSSCAEEFTSGDIESVYIAPTSEDFLSNEQLPAIMFSYNIYDPQSDMISSWLIDTEGNLRTAETESDVAFEGDYLSPYYMETKKEESSLTDNTVDLDELVQNFVKLNNTGNMSYDIAAESDDSQKVTTVYGYYYQTSEDSTDLCGCASGEAGSESLQMYEPILLEQKVGGKLIQQNERASAIITWLNTINAQAE